MTVDEMRDAIEASYKAALSPWRGVRYPVEVPPPPFTPMAWDSAIKLDRADLSPEEFRTKWADPLGRGLAIQGLDLGLDTFARLTVEDRPAAAVKSAGGAVMRRPRTFIVHAIGWRS